MAKRGGDVDESAAAGSEGVIVSGLDGRRATPADVSSQTLESDRAWEESRLLSGALPFSSSSRIFFFSPSSYEVRSRAWNSVYFWLMSELSLFYFLIAISGERACSIINGMNIYSKTGFLPIGSCDPVEAFFFPTQRGTDQICNMYCASGAKCVLSDFVKLDSDLSVMCM